jgi:class 3 adenylate cyclase/tetratricopeptide (TPR) repeat protein
VCPRCNRAAAQDDRFCGGCGTALPQVCSRCDRPLGPDTDFCTGCGTPRAAARPDQVHSEDRRRISVLFVDLIDFTPYVERTDPEQVREIQTGFFSAVRRVIAQYGGVVEKYIGDAVMALFGAPVATEIDAVRCVRAGLELQRVLERYADGGLRCRVGITTGEALVDVAAARDGGQAIVAGDVVNTAARLQSVAPPGGVLVCGATYAATKGAIRYSPQPPVTLRGRSQQTEVWLALAPIQRSHPDREMRTTPLVNRTHELSLLVNALDRALTDRIPQLVTVLGHAGIGKSRLVRELYRHAQERSAPALWYTGRCPPFGENVTYAALADIVKAYAGILDTDSAQTARRRLDGAMRELVTPAEAARLSDAIGPLVGLPGSKLGTEEAESAWRRFLVALASRESVVLIIEDLHWADENMLRFVEVLGASVREVPLLMVATARPELVEHHPGWSAATPGALTITLPPLRAPEIATMYTHLLGQATYPDETLATVVELADGNPLYAHEYTRMLIEQDALRPMMPFRDGVPPMPDGVHAVIANRVDLLEPADRAVIQAAAVVGLAFWPGAVAAALGRPEEAVERTLRRLEQRDLVHEQVTSSMEGQLEYRFGHVLVRDVCYQRLPRTERVARHERTADWLDRISTSRDTDLAEVLAHHRYTAYEIARTLGSDAGRYAPAARDALNRAARRAYALQALEPASNHAARALGLCDDNTAPAERLGIELLVGEIAFYADGNAYLTEGGENRMTLLAQQLHDAGDQSTAARAWTLLGQAAWLRADRATALSCLDRAVELFDELPDTPEKADAYAELGRLHMLNMEDGPAVAAAGIATDIASQLGLVEVAANARITVGMSRYQAGDRRGLAELREVARLCREQRLLALRRADQNLSYALREEGDWPASFALLHGEGGVPGGHNLTTGYSDRAQRAYFDGDWELIAGCAREAQTSPSDEWDLHSRGMCLWIDQLRGGRFVEEDAQALLRAGRRTGFHRLVWVALGQCAFSFALHGQLTDAEALLLELGEGWQKVRAIASGEWLPTAAHAAVLVGRSASVALRELLSEVPHRTPWVEAALRTVSGAVAAADGDRVRAGVLHRAASALYGDIPNVTNRVLALAWAVAADPSDRASVAEVRAFAASAGAPRLLTLAGLE